MAFFPPSLGDKGQLGSLFSSTVSSHLLSAPTRLFNSQSLVMHLSPTFTTRAVFSLLLSTSLVNAGTVSSRASVCNGHAELCDRSFGNITFVGAHDSYAVGVNNLAANQDQNVTQQLTDGIRMLQVQAHNNSGTINLCHTSCALYNGGTLQNYLSEVVSWMNANPNDVVSMLIVNSDNLPATQFASTFQAAGADKLAYSPSSASMPASSWPTLGTLIDAGTRLVAFMASGADFTSAPYIIDEFTNIWETAFDVTDTTFDCSVNRTASGADTSTQMFLINHFLDQDILGQPAPDVGQANVTNGVSGVGSLGQQVSTCVQDYGRNPNFLLVDFYEYGAGSVFQVAATANGVTYDPSTPIASPASTSSSSGAGSSATNLSNGDKRVLRVENSPDMARKGRNTSKECSGARVAGMSFQHFRLHSIPPQGTPQPAVATVTALAHAVSPSSLSQALGQTQNTATVQPQPVQQTDVVSTPSGTSTPLTRVQSGGKKGPYGSGDVDDGYTLVFESMAAFQAWRQKEEEEKMVEFVKGDTHGSKAVPPRFKDHTKLVCARHTRSGRKKYVKKYPDRVRKVPSRKLEGQGCPASISYKTYFDTQEVRACCKFRVRPSERRL
ncbi:hypothetical protein NM688_g5493 [Phlebia brevispora]|uniref:Uncharacterized protein n=1 Tax=Phlebia brevispora TaxID=194682 RepID=A0ACC1SUA6_9APHY|nr:hypothetical protein NM688_g5493 [Phlebia brevispora]